MNYKKHKLRLRKPFIVAFPIIGIVIILGLILAINTSHSFKNEISKEEWTAEKIEVNDTTNNDEDDPDLNIETHYISENKYILALNKMVATRQKDNTIIYYAQKFHLNVDKTLEIAHTLTNNYEDEEYNQNYIIAPSSLKQKLSSFQNFEAGVVYFVKNLYSYPEYYGVTIEEMRIDENPDTDHNIIDGTIYMDNGLTFAQYLGHICDLFGVEKSIALAIVYEESGIMTSNLFNNKNNIGGQKGYTGWMTFNSLEAGVISFVISLNAMITNNNIDMTSSDAIYTLSGIYVNGNLSNPSTSWTEKVTYFQQKIEEKDLFTITK